MTHHLIRLRQQRTQPRRIANMTAIRKTTSNHCAHSVRLCVGAMKRKIAQMNVNRRRGHHRITTVARCTLWKVHLCASVCIHIRIIISFAYVPAPSPVQFRWSNAGNQTHLLHMSDAHIARRRAGRRSFDKGITASNLT
jgi:hypothetical protein